MKRIIAIGLGPAAALTPRACSSSEPHRTGPHCYSRTIRRPPWRAECSEDAHGKPSVPLTAPHAHHPHRPQACPVSRRRTSWPRDPRVYFGHGDCVPRWELRADVGAATLLLRLAEWRQAVRMPNTVEAVPHELDIHLQVVRIYHSHLEGTL